MVGSTHRAGVLCLLVHGNQFQVIHNLENSHQIKQKDEEYAKIKYCTIEKMTGGALEVHCDKSLTLLTFGI